MDWSSILITVLSTVGTALLTWLTTWLTKLISSKVKDSNTATMLTSITNSIMSAVKTVYQTYVEKLKDDGTFTDAEKAEAKARATTLITNALTDEQKAYIKSAFGDVSTYISEQIESTVYTLKK